MIDPKDLLIQSMADVTQGGQHVGVAPTVIRIVHVPTGLSATCGTERSQMRNKNIALNMLEYGLLEIGWKK